MQAKEFISCLRNVRRTSRGWVGSCPGHEDKTPSLSIREGERGLLVKCWAGCTIEQICRALNLQIGDLFFDRRIDPEDKRKRDQELRKRDRQRVQATLRNDALREAEATITVAQSLDISHWSNEQLDAALNRLTEAYVLLEMETM